MRTLSTGFMAMAVLVLLATPVAAGTSFNPVGDACQTNVSLSEDVFLQTLGDLSLEIQPQPIPAANVICCTRLDCCVFMEQATCLAGGGSVYPTALGCNKACRSCG